MTSKKRWDEIYAGDNPLSLPQSIVRGVREHARRAASNGSPPLRYLWLYVSEHGEPGGAPLPDCERMTADDWLSVVDEAAAHGCRYAIISVGAALRDHPEVVEMSAWAQSAHDITVGIHMYNVALPREEASLLSRLDPAKTRFFIEDDLAESVGFLADHGFMLLSAEGQHQEVVSPECHLPEEMTCVSATGRLYTCGLVLGDESYGLGHVLDRKLKVVMRDASLPHWIPEGLPKAHHRCNGCPPLMIRRMHEVAG